MVEIFRLHLFIFVLTLVLKLVIG